MLQDIADPDWVVQPALDPAFRAMLAHDLTFDALVKPVHLRRIGRLAARYPDLRIVLDHGAKPDIAGRQWSDWAAGIERLALYPNVYCKLSGLWTECTPGAAVTAVERYGRHLLACFGAPRLLWGSDWPVLELAGSYGSWHGAASSLCTPAQVSLVFGDAARRAYRL
jgi:L-fuconolactonase